MREILFRGRSKPYNETHQMDEWLYGDLVRLADGKAVHSYIYGKGEVDPKTVGQYTGLTDKNGKMIFEGDIVQRIVQRLECNDDYRFEVEWLEVYAGFYPFFDQDNECGYGIIAQNCEVIGNIYDEPELLKGEK